MSSRASQAVLVLVVVSLLALAGCAGGPDDQGDPTATTNVEDPTRTDRTTTPTRTTGAAATVESARTTESGENATARPTVTLVAQNGTVLANVTMRVANTSQERFVGLSETDSLADGEGMLFVHDTEDIHSYVMRNMSFPLDIVFVGSNGTITRIHHAAAEPDASGGELTRYRGRGKYVLEVPRGYTNATGVDEGDVVRIPSGVD